MVITRFKHRIISNIIETIYAIKLYLLFIYSFCLKAIVEQLRLSRFNVIKEEEKPTRKYEAIYVYHFYRNTINIIVRTDLQYYVLCVCCFFYTRIFVDRS